jgi:hypothetical protein
MDEACDILDWSLMLAQSMHLVAIDIPLLDSVVSACVQERELVGLPCHAQDWTSQVLGSRLLHFGSTLWLFVEVVVHQHLIVLDLPEHGRSIPDRNSHEVLPSLHVGLTLTG